MSKESVKQALQARLAEIDELLGQYDKLVAEREDIERFLARYEGQDRVVPLFSGTDSTQIAKRVPHRRFKPNPNSKTARIIDETRRILAQTPDGTATFLDTYHKMPDEVFVGLKHPREYMRTSLKRAGMRAGIVFSGKMLILRDLPRTHQMQAPGCTAGGA